MKTTEKENIIERAPVVVVMGHIDHGKSTLLDYIRKTNVVKSEAGGITQHISAYEVIHKDDNGKDKKITFLDTPGHEAFSKMRERGAKIADIAILVVSAEDGVKPQTIEAWKTITESNTPYLVAINKIDKPEANIEKVKMELAENEIYLENYGGKVPFTPISAKTGEGVDDLLTLVNILAELENLTGNKNQDASGFVVEANLDQRRGIEATLIIKNGTLAKGMTVVVEDSICSTRIIENFLGNPIDEACFSSPVKLIGFDKMPKVGGEFKSFKKKSDALLCIEEFSTKKTLDKKVVDKVENENSESKIIPIILRADTWGSIEAVEKEIGKIKANNAEYRVVQKGVGPIGERDIKNISSEENIIVIGFNVKADKNAIDLSMQRNIPIAFFDIIYKMTEWLGEEMEKRKPKVNTIEITGRAKIIKAFSRTKERQIVGGKVAEGRIKLDSVVKIIRRENEIGQGKIVNLEKGKEKTREVEEGAEFGMMIESKIEIAGGDILEAFSIVQK
jgi:translation initiation factor IF-2